jgi:hypothetical protein
LIVITIIIFILFLTNFISINFNTLFYTNSKLIFNLLFIFHNQCLVYWHPYLILHFSPCFFLLILKYQLFLIVIFQFLVHGLLFLYLLTFVSYYSLPIIILYFLLFFEYLEKFKRIYYIVQQWLLVNYHFPFNLILKLLLK